MDSFIHTDLDLVAFMLSGKHIGLLGSVKHDSVKLASHLLEVARQA